ncbi:TRAP transporter substrate-binding protein [Pseudomonas seleniipraecipitans]|uniref:TRAP transporter substrate-binding protein n=1 Tax=Phytopseudomonas seleniipraecipitans TaxID=640205 RepID=A0ABY5J8D8_9GAMM|nr:TRAP transporter substrate-binding protein [Pseudomonas seleniipraecipitans]UUD62740.1 TRAP transporter substrate-binding protein [Pseudomonas seleniipraecipitans]
MISKTLISALMGAALLSAHAAAAEITLQFGHPANEKNIWHQAAEHFKTQVEKDSGGRIKVQLYPSEQLGNEMDIINSIQLGTADMTLAGESLQNWAPKAAMLAVPYAFRDSEHLRKAVEGKVGEEIKAQITERTNLVPIAWFERGSRQLTTNRPITTPEELKGLRLRVPNVPLFVDTWQTMGARPTPMALGEVFTALQQNVIEGQENPLSLIESSSLYEVQKYVNRTDHVRSWIYVVIGKKQLDGMPDDLRAVVLNAASEMQTFESGLFEKDQQRLEASLKERGMEFIDVDAEAFANKARPAVLEALTSEQRALFDAIQNL